MSDDLIGTYEVQGGLDDGLTFDLREEDEEDDAPSLLSV